MARVVLVTGGGKGIGRAVCERFTAAGDRVVAVGRDTCDVTDEAQVERLFEEVGPLDVLVNNAGVATSNRLSRVTLDEWRHHLDVNATGAFLCTRAALGGMLDRGSGRIVTVASTAGKRGERYTAAYTASKQAAVWYLASPEAAAVNGQTLVLDGGGLQA